MSFADGGQNHGIASPSGDARVRVHAKEMDVKPRIYIVELRIARPDGSFDLGTAFLVPSDPLKYKHCFFVTAGHNLCSANLGFALEVRVFGGKDADRLGIQKVMKAVHGGPPPPDENWFAVHPELDMGVIAILRDQVQSRFLQGGGFKVVDDLEPTYIPREAMVSGFPLELNPEKATPTKLALHTMCEHYGEVTIDKSSPGKRHLKYKIDTSKGQSGSPVWLPSKTSSDASVNEWVAIGVHVRDRTLEADPYNQAVILRQAHLPMLFAGFYSPPKAVTEEAMA